MSSVERSVYEAIWESPKPTVAAIFGWTLGAGCELSLACDLRIAADTLRIGLPESKLGLAANFGAQSLVRLIPRAVAYKMLYTGAHLDAAEAARWGLINEVVPQSDLDARAEEVVREIVASAPLSTQRYKSIITTGAELPFSSALRVTAGPNPYASEDRAEGARAFREKRPPQWRGV